MLDEGGRIIYVGKAKKLKNRVSSYFTGAHNAKVEAMIEKIADFNTIQVKSEFEALMLENALIKKHQPHYNILLKDDKGYPFIVINMKEEWPRFEISAKKKGKYFGPYGGRAVSKEIIQALCASLALPDCSLSFPQKRPCLNYQLKLCEGWCVKGNREEYFSRLEHAFMLLEGRGGELIEQLREKMLSASDSLQFELAAQYRDRIKSIESLGNRQRVSSGWAERNLEEQKSRDNAALEKSRRSTLSRLGRMLGIGEELSIIEAFDVSNLKDSGIVAAMTCFREGKPWKKGYKKFRIKDMPVQNDYASMEQAVYRRLKRYADGDESFAPLPELMLIDGGEEHAKAALRAAAELGLGLPIFGMVKDSRHRTRALISPEGEEISISASPDIFSLIGRIQEETHRFAIEYQRSLRYENCGSELDGIPGVGPARKAALLNEFKTVKAVKNASLEELMRAVPRNTAEAVRKYYESSDREGQRTQAEDS